MKYCSHCGAQILEEAIFCPKCGCATDNQSTSKTAKVVNISGTKTAAKVFMIIGTVIQGMFLLPLAWCLPLTISYCGKINRGEPVSTGFKVCSLLFVSMIGGILMLCDND